MCRWLYSVADDFFTKQLPHNVTWGLTVLYALDASKDLTNLAVQVTNLCHAHFEPKLCALHITHHKAWTAV